MYCQHCGHKNNPESKFCEACGKPTTVSTTTLQPDRTANKNLKILALVALIAVAAVVIWILVSQVGGLLTPTPSASDIQSILANEGHLGQQRDVTVIRQAECQLSPNRKASTGYRSEWIVEYSRTAYSPNWVSPKRPDGLMTDTGRMTVGLREDGSWVRSGWSEQCGQ